MASLCTITLFYYVTTTILEYLGSSQKIKNIITNRLKIDEYKTMETIEISD